MGVEVAPAAPGQHGYDNTCGGGAGPSCCCRWRSQNKSMVCSRANGDRTNADDAGGQDCRRTARSAKPGVAPGAGLAAIRHPRS